jgi:hypothetical protein
LRNSRHRLRRQALGLVAVLAQEQEQAQGPGLVVRQALRPGPGPVLPRGLPPPRVWDSEPSA